jgi:hypothetical protein
MATTVTTMKAVRTATSRHDSWVFKLKLIIVHFLSDCKNKKFCRYHHKKSEENACTA